ncbi:MAG: hypothetical protein ACOC1S_00635 [bacterium]
MKRNKLFFVSVILLMSVLLLSSCFLDNSNDLKPELSVSPEYIHTEPGGTTSFTIANQGTGKLEWEIDTPKEWLEFSESEGRGMKQIQVSSADSASKGSNAVIEISSNGGKSQIDFLVSENPVPEVQEFDARGITAPEDKIESTIIEEENLSSAQGQETSIEVNDITKREVSSGFETGYIFSWVEVNNADGYEIYREEEDGNYQLLVDLDPSEIEKVKDNLVYVDVCNDDIGEEKNYKIRAYKGSYSGNFVESRAVILPETELVTPAAGDTLNKGKPVFNWSRIDNISGSQLMLAGSDEEDIFFRKNLTGENNEYDYGETEETLSAGDYNWGVLTVGEPVAGEENISGLSLSKFREFTVE